MASALQSFAVHPVLDDDDALPALVEFHDGHGGQGFSARQPTSGAALDRRDDARRSAVSRAAPLRMESLDQRRAEAVLAAERMARALAAGIAALWCDLLCDHGPAYVPRLHGLLLSRHRRLDDPQAHARRRGGQRSLLALR